MSNKIISGMLLLIFSSTINLHASLSEKVALIRQKVKNSIEKITLKDALTYTALVGVGVVLIAHHYKLNRIRNIFNKNLDNLEATKNEIKLKINHFEEVVSQIQSNLIAQRKLSDVIAAFRNNGFYPHTEIEEEDGEIIRQTTLSINDRFNQVRQQIIQIQDQLSKLYDQQVDQSNNQLPVKRQENLQPDQTKNQEGQKHRRKKVKNKVS